MPDTDTGKTGTQDPPADSDTGGQQEPDYKAEVAKWKAMARKHEEQAKVNADAAKRLKEAEDAEKTAVDKASERAAEAERRAVEAEAKALRYEIATAKGVPARLMRFLPTGTQEELEAAADELLEAIKPTDTAGSADKAGRPKERLRSGASNSEGEEVDIRKVIAELPHA